MEHFFPDYWSTLYLGLILSITLAQMLVVYDLSAASAPPKGLGMFTVYALATMLGWMLFTLHQGIESPLGIGVPSVAWVINGYLLFIAAGQRAGLTRGRASLGVMCVLGSLGALFLDDRQLFALCAVISGLCFAASGVIFARRGTQQHNVGDAIMCVATVLMVAGNLIGLYQLFFRSNYSDAQLVSFGAYSWAYVLVVVGFLASVLVEYQQHLSHLATIDPLTQLLNRRGLETSLQISLARASRQDLYTSAIAIDIDHFKNINDSFGHETGDNVIRIVAGIIAKTCRGTDVVARIGGEEFLLVMPDTGLEFARRVAERLREAIGEHPLWVDRQRIPITLSLGVAGSRGEVNLDQLQQEADRAMYLAKRNGRNRVAWIDKNPIHLSNGGG
ncbi:GGDEF domain-containing protein [Haliea sp. E17]|uniref:GGDEF domain-containing protein n=1 Tax=Haliea sp. E17 TaxID=3401576 RepID=UPI003AAC88CD